MSVASQLYRLQEMDIELESNERAVGQVTHQLGDREIVIEAENKLDSERRRLEGLIKQQRSTEWEIDDITIKLKDVEERLYSGRIRNPKELTDLQHEADGLKARRVLMEDKALEVMEQVELTTRKVSDMDTELGRLDSEWQVQQKHLSADLARLQTLIADLKQQRQLLVAGIDPQTVAIYQELRKKRGAAVAKVEQGLCCGCRIMLPVSDFQRVRTGDLVRCGSCGRILFLA
jgi:predicted  nucleic acid-binding Zn-ribbon protein